MKGKHYCHLIKTSSYSLEGAVSHSHTWSLQAFFPSHVIFFSISDIDNFESHLSQAVLSCEGSSVTVRCLENHIEQEGHLFQPKIPKVRDHTYNINTTVKFTTQFLSKFNIITVYRGVIGCFRELTKESIFG